VPGVTRLVSVVTAVHRRSVRFLGAAYESLAAQVLPDGWDWQWLVQEDGGSVGASRVLPRDDRISIASGRPFGPGVARTYALARADGEFVKVLDADDLLTRGSLARDIDVLSMLPDVGWTTCRARDLLPDGTTAGVSGALAPGRVRRGDVLRRWIEDGHRPPVHPATLCIRRGLLLNLGGWMALPAGEDTGLLLAADAVAEGYFISPVGLLYRKWPGQLTAQFAHLHPDERTHRNAVIEARARALANTFARSWDQVVQPTA